MRARLGHQSQALYRYPSYGLFSSSCDRATAAVQSPGHSPIPFMCRVAVVQGAHPISCILGANREGKAQGTLLASCVAQYLWGLDRAQGAYSGCLPLHWWARSMGLRTLTWPCWGLGVMLYESGSGFSPSSVMVQGRQIILSGMHRLEGGHPKLCPLALLPAR